MQIVYFSSASGNTHRFVERLALPAARLPRGEAPGVPFVLICPTYSDHTGAGAVPKPVIHLLNRPESRALLRGVIGAGNRNFGETFALAARIIARKCNVPLLYRFELAGTETDIARVRAGLQHLEDMPCSMPA
ncbi:protein involved in ribonucleotide reduction [Poseidonocella pacifica]|uniref:Protein NrdI n=1 Tax=Poseidonocella pacifica TaxID=871651 RepID=A0A1I0VUK7_9RHOB|nr:class Ib ribonucleoside-diphosphate reductase assembly flavoprotein NrdI [Poseidonocella pacifica]SFA79717.1 protein involved in ribonucleotide reduction [Poseidonocella pacifica]